MSFSFQELVDQVIEIWMAGGSLMIPLAILGLMIYLVLGELFLHLLANSYFKLDPNEYGHWVDRPDEAKGKVGEVIRYSQEGCQSAADVRLRVAEIRQASIPPIQRRLVFATMLINAAPLTGLLGTVMGMLSTFLGLSVSSGAGNTIDMVAGGISEALITTQTGLVFAIPGYVLVSYIKKQLAELDHFFTQLEILTAIKFERRNREKSQPAA
ncbi:MAG: MotA/TolQ/ExbB proton channel family protein [Verrucomicrobiota bacterium JB022]|nr:MotA/TolQ/ExbB proton channel family protein [Verrucomicrobiota bacterium JB022]